MSMGVDLMYDELKRNGCSEAEANRKIAEAWSKASSSYVIRDLEKNRAHASSTDVLRELLANSPAGLPGDHYLSARYSAARNAAVAHILRKELQ